MKRTNTIHKKWNELTEAEKRAKKQARKQSLDDLEQTLNVGVENVLKSENYKEYLKVMQSFHNYSVKNTILIYQQALSYGFTPTLIKGFQGWKQLGRNVMKGSKAIKIYAPMKLKFTKKQDPENMALVPYGEETEDETIEYLSFKIENVFDISQTQGTELSSVTHELKSGVTNFNSIAQALVKLAPCAVKVENINEYGCYGYYSYDHNCIVIQENIGEMQCIITLCHEIAHSVMHNRKIQGLEHVTSQEMEIQAESVAFMLCNYLGLDTSDYSFGYLASWIDSKNKDDVKKLNDNMEIIKTCADALIDKLEKILNDETQISYNAPTITAPANNSIEQIALF